MLGPFGATELIIILILALIIFGPGKLPDVGRAIGKSLREFKRASSATDDESDADGEKTEKKEPQSIDGPKGT